MLAVALAAVLGGVGYYLTHYYDPVRVVYKRWKAPSKYVFEEIAPRFLKTDPATLIYMTTRDDATRTRAALRQAVLGGDPQTHVRPARLEEGYKLAKLDGMVGLARIDRLTIPVGNTYTARAYHLRPVRANGRVVIYQHGYAGTIEDAREMLAALVGAGYAVIGLNNYKYGENRTREAVIPRVGLYRLDMWNFLNLLEHPLRAYFHPIVVAINYAVATLGVSEVDMVGFSNGGWMTMVAAAIDPRIRRSYPVAGAYPIYLRSGETKVHQPEHFYRPMLLAATYPEIYILSALEPARRQIQVFNRFDRCCWRNTKARLYEPAVRDTVKRLGGGTFAVLIDETHADHKVSAFARSHILEDLARP